MDHVTLNGGMRMPIVGFGVFRIPDPAECERGVLDAIDAGCRLIEAAASRVNEEAVGRALRVSGLQRGIVALARSMRKDRTARNPSVFDPEPDDEDPARIASLDAGRSALFPPHDPAIAKWMAEHRLDSCRKMP